MPRQRIRLDHLPQEQLVHNERHSSHPGGRLIQLHVLLQRRPELHLGHRPGRLHDRQGRHPPGPGLQPILSHNLRPVPYPPVPRQQLGGHGQPLQERHLGHQQLSGRPRRGDLRLRMQQHPDREPHGSNQLIILPDKQGIQRPQHNGHRDVHLPDPDIR